MKLVFFTTAAALFGAVAAAPLVRKEASIVQRDVEVLGVRFVSRDVAGLPTPQSIQFKDKRDDDFAKRDGDKIVPKIINREAAPEPQDIPAEVPVKSDGNAIVVYGKRQIPAEIPVKSDGDQIIQYVKRQDDGIPAEVPVKSVNGIVVEYVKRQENVIPAEVPVKTVNGNIVTYVKRQDIPAEVAVKSNGDAIVVY